MLLKNLFAKSGRIGTNMPESDVTQTKLKAAELKKAHVKLKAAKI